MIESWCCRRSLTRGRRHARRARALGRALTLAEPEGFVRIFVDEGPPMAALLKAAARHGMPQPTSGRLLAAVRPGPRAARRVDQALVEPLSERELDVLRLLATDLDGPDIARELVVSLNTVRSHTKNIYAKLGVNDRRAAVRRATELDLLSRRATAAPGRATAEVATAPHRRRSCYPGSSWRSKIHHVDHHLWGCPAHHVRP